MIRLSLALGATALGVLLAAPAAADPQQDQNFFDTLDHLGFVVISYDGMRSQGQTVCYDLNQGSPEAMVLRNLAGIGYDFEESAMIYSAAIAAYCPWNSPIPASNKIEVDEDRPYDPSTFLY